MDNLNSSTDFEVLLSKASEEQLIKLYLEAVAYGFSHDELYLMIEFDEVFQHMKPLDLFEMGLDNFSTVNTQDDYFIMVDGVFGDLISYTPEELVEKIRSRYKYELKDFYETIKEKFLEIMQEEI